METLKMIKNNFEVKTMNNIKRSLTKQIEADFFANYLSECYGIKKASIVNQYQKKKRNKGIVKYALEYIDNTLARVNYLTRMENRNAGIGEMMYYTKKKEYNEEIKHCKYYGVPAEFVLIKDKERDLSIQIERSLF